MVWRCSRRRGWVTSVSVQVRRRAECALQNLRALHSCSSAASCSGRHQQTGDSRAAAGAAAQALGAASRLAPAAAPARVGGGADGNAGPVPVVLVLTDARHGVLPAAQRTGLRNREKERDGLDGVWTTSVAVAGSVSGHLVGQREAWRDGEGASSA